MITPEQFPPSLLQASKRSRWLYFYHKIVAHPRLVAVDQDLKQAIWYATPGRLILVFGPTGVGKTTLRRGIERALTESVAPELSQDRERLPVAGVEAVAPEQGNFDWLDFYQRTLHSLHEPLIQDKVRVTEETSARPAPLLSPGQANLRSLRQALEQCLQHRRPVAVIIDDAHHFQKVAGARRLLDQMDALKSLANRSQTVWVLLGTYELLNLTNLNDQLSHRSYHLPFQRYQADQPQDIQAFQTILQTFQYHLPLPEPPMLTPRWDYFYEYSAGCIGILKLWLNNALAAALEQDQATLTEPILQRCALSPDRLLNIVREMVEGERRLLELAEKQAQLRAMLGLSSSAPAPETAPPARQKRRVGERRPRRDPIGEAAHVT